MPLSPDGVGVAVFLGRDGDSDFIYLAEEHAALVTTFVRSYTRGRGFDTATGDPNEDLAAVIVTATARLVSNPTTNRSERIGDFSTSPAVDGWTLAETAVLHRYRRRTA